jgi:type IV pilus assembly protein PilC
MEFRCRLATAGGQILEGVYVAESEARLRHELEEKGLYVLSLQSRGGLSLPTFAGGRGRRRRVRSQEFLVFNQELATLLKAGMPLVQSLDILRQRIANPTFKAVLDTIYEKVKAGTALSDAFGEHSTLFPPVYAASLLAGERSGNLDAVIRRYVAYEKVIGAVKRKTISALYYPAVLVALMTLVIGVIVIKVVPAFSDFYAGFGSKELPLSTRIVVAASHFLIANGWLIILAVVATVFLARMWVRQPGQRERLDHVLLGVPWVGLRIRKFGTTQLARTLATLLGGGIPLVNAIEISARSMSNRYLARELEEARRRVQEGESFAGALRAKGTFPDVAIKMVEVGESTGALQEMLNSLADFYDEEIETEVARFITLIEPILLVVTGVIIALVVLALYLPLFQLTSVVGA